MRGRLPYTGRTGARAESGVRASRQSGPAGRGVPLVNPWDTT